MKTAAGGERELACGQVLVAAGRRPVSAGLNLSAVGGPTGSRGEIVTDTAAPPDRRTARQSEAGIPAGCGSEPAIGGPLPQPPARALARAAVIPYKTVPACFAAVIIRACSH
jgi:hypothetical protein